MSQSDTVMVAVRLQPTESSRHRIPRVAERRLKMETGARLRIRRRRAAMIAGDQPRNMNTEYGSHRWTRIGTDARSWKRKLTFSLNRRIKVNRDENENISKHRLPHAPGCYLCEGCEGDAQTHVEAGFRDFGRGGYLHQIWSIDEKLSAFLNMPRTVALIVTASRPTLES
jgi:hypothetical protein